LTNFMVVFCQKVDENFKNINSQLSQMRGESGGCRPKQPQAQRQQQVQLPSPSPAPSPAVFHQISEVPARSPSLVPRLSTLRRDPTLTRQAQDLVDGLDNTVTGTSVCDKCSKQGWARSGGELAPRVPTPWPQDHVIGQGRRYKLFYDDLNIYEWSQGILSIMEAEEELSVIKYMLTHYRSVYRDAQNHGFEAAKWSNGVVLSMLEKGKLTWDQTYKMAEERRSALVAASTSNRERQSYSPPPRDPRPSRQSVCNNGERSSNNRNSGNNSKKVVKACAFFNNGSCPHNGHHETGSTRWRHVCKQCWDPNHVVKDCLME
jgi:hypothetical protein